MVSVKALTADAGRRVLLYELLGFGLIVVLSWADELIGLPARLFSGNVSQGGWQEIVLETLIVLAVAAGTMYFTSRLVRRLLYLEQFLRICAWCQKINYDGKWLPFADFVRAASEERLHCTHGICDQCAEEVMKSLHHELSGGIEEPARLEVRAPGQHQG